MWLKDLKFLDLFFPPPILATVRKTSSKKALWLLSRMSMIFTKEGTPDGGFIALHLLEQDSGSFRSISLHAFCTAYDEADSPGA